MSRLFRPEATRAMDQRAGRNGVSATTLMERAAGHLARVVCAVAGHSYGLSVVLACGKGDNGGDGIAAARRLQQMGAAPIVWLSASAADLSPESAAQLARYRAEGGRIGSDLAALLAHADIAVDCLLGTGTSGAPRGAIAEAITALNAASCPVVACDLPSGVDAESGEVGELAVQADATMTIGAEKTGLRLWPARAYCGELVCVDIGILQADDQADAYLLERDEVADILGELSAQADKRSRGVVLIVAGQAGMSGAAIMAARGALQAGAGLVTVALPHAAQATVAAAVPEAMTLALPEDVAAAAALIIDHAARSDAVVMGPGRGVSAQAIAVTHAVVRAVTVPLVLDADALNAYRGQATELAHHQSRCLVLTPHQGELARLVGDERWPQRFAELPEYAARWRAVVVAKGPGTLIAAPDGRRWINSTGGPALATGGSGDVLAGMLGALLAPQASAERVAAGVYLHGLASDLAAASGAPRSAGPGALLDALPLAWQQIAGAR